MYDTAGKARTAVLHAPGTITPWSSHLIRQVIQTSCFPSLHLAFMPQKVCVPVRSLKYSKPFKDAQWASQT